MLRKSFGLVLGLTLSGLGLDLGLMAFAEIWRFNGLFKMVAVRRLGFVGRM